MMKKIFSLLLAVAMVMSLAVCVSAETVPTMYLKADEINASGILTVYVSVKDNIVPTEEITTDEGKIGLGALQLKVEYDKNLFTLNNVSALKLDGESFGTPTINKDAATVVWGDAFGLRVSKGEDESYNALYRYFKEADMFRYVFKLNTENVTEADYGKEVVFKFSDSSNATYTPALGGAGTPAAIGDAIKVEIPDNREAISGLSFDESKLTAEYTGSVIANPAVKGMAETDSVVYTIEKDGKAVSEIVDAGTYSVTAAVSREGFKKTKVGPVNFVVSPKNVEYTVKDASMYVGEAVPAFETTEKVADGIKLDYTKIENPAVGEHEITATVAADSSKNYNVKVNPGKLTVKKKVEVTVKDAEITYGDKTPVAFETNETLDDGIKLVYTVKGAGEGLLDADTYEIEAAVAEDSSKFYEVTVKSSGTLTVKAKDAKIKADNKKQIIGKGMVDLTATLEGVLEADKSGITYDLNVEGYADTKGDYTIKVSNIAGERSKNYNFVPVDGTYSVITAIPVNVVVTDAKKAYGDEDPDFEYYVVPDEEHPEITNDVVEVSRVEGEDVGDYAFTAVLKDGGLDKDKYAIGEVKGKFTIEKKTVKVKANDVRVKIGKEIAADAFKATAEGFVGEDTITDLAFTFKDAEGNAVAESDLSTAKKTTYTISVTGTFDTAKYDVEYEDGTLTVYKASTGGGATGVIKPATNPKDDGKKDDGKTDDGKKDDDKPKYSKDEIVLTIGNKEIGVWGETKQNDVAPEIVNNRTMLPIRVIAEALGATVGWDEATQTVTIEAKDISIKLVIGESKATVNNETVELDCASYIKNDRTYLPLRFVSEKLGAKVVWDESTQRVTITK